MKTGDILYHAHIVGGIQVDYEEYVIIRETAKCVFVVPQGYQGYDWALRSKKRIHKGATKRFAWPTKKEALQSLYLRKYHNLKHMQERVRSARLGLCVAEAEAKKQGCWTHENEEDNQ